jgi:peptidoglycan/LPS O-acetylase OafA/YrhL
VLTWLGERSYGLYVLHAIALVFFNWQAIPSLVVTVAAAAFSYRFMELPCIAYSRRERSSRISYSPSFGRFW